MVFTFAAFVSVEQLSAGNVTGGEDDAGVTDGYFLTTEGTSCRGE